jgi:hypothetical protein
MDIADAIEMNIFLGTASEGIYQQLGDPDRVNLLKEAFMKST